MSERLLELRLFPFRERGHETGEFGLNIAPEPQDLAVDGRTDYCFDADADGDDGAAFAAAG